MVMCSLSNKTISSSSEDDSELRRGPWTLEEDNLLVHYIARHGEGRWNLLAKRAGLRRTGKSCRLRWLNYLKPDVRRGNLSPQEQLLILDLHSKWGNKWSKIAQYLPGRTDNEIKNYWRTRVQKQARHLKLDANSTEFQDVIRSFWMPRLFQEIDGSNPPWAMVPQNPIISPSVSYAQHPTLPPPLPPQEMVPSQGAVDMTVTMHSEQHQEQNSDSEQCTGSSISSTESMNIAPITPLSEYPTSPFHTTGNYSDCSTFLKDCQYVDSNCYGMEGVNLGTTTVPEGLGYPGDDFHVAESDWVGYDLGDTMWKIDELWQFRNS